LDLRGWRGFLDDARGKAAAYRGGALCPGRTLNDQPFSKGADMLVQPYLSFDGRCEKAIEFYRKALGAETTMLMRFKESPEREIVGGFPDAGPSRSFAMIGFA
jgi:hypothetical protein